MDLIESLRGRVRWTYQRARYVARTEGVDTLARRAAGVAGLPVGEQVAAAQLSQPTRDEASAAWPTSVLVISAGGPRVADLRVTGIPTLFRPPGASDLADLLQAVRIVYVLGAAQYPGPALRAEGKRLHQVWVQELLPGDPADPLDADLVVLAEPRATAGAPAAVVVPLGRPLREVLLRGAA